MLFGLDKIGEGTVEQAHVAVNDVINRLDPLLTKIYMMARALLHGVINRFQVDITIKINPDPGENPSPKEY